MKYHLANLSRSEYKDSIAHIEDATTSKFANESLMWWDRHFSWKPHGCIVLCDENDLHLCYVFYKIDRYRDYLTIHNLFTPFAQRRYGYASKLLELVFDDAITQNVSRFRLSCVSKSLDFYLALGFVFWGLNSEGDYYCDMPMPLKELATLYHTCQTTQHLLEESFDLILDKVKDNHIGLQDGAKTRYEEDKKKLGSSYRLTELLTLAPKLHLQ